MAGPGLLAHVLVGKYADSLPLYRHCQIDAREGVVLERSTLTDWVGQAVRLLTPLAQAIGRHVLRAAKIHVIINLESDQGHRGPALLHQAGQADPEVGRAAPCQLQEPTGSGATGGREIWVCNPVVKCKKPRNRKSLI